MYMRNPVALFGVLLCLLLGSKETQSESILNVPHQFADLIGDQYVLIERGVEFAKLLKEKERSGDYAGLDSVALADQLTKDIQQLSGDGHIYIERKQEDGEDWITSWLENAPSTNFGIEQARVLPGDVGYIKIGSFYPLDIAQSSYVEAFNRVQATNGLILDLRDNGGGDGTSANAIIATFLTASSPSPLLIQERILGSNNLLQKPLALPAQLLWARYSRELVILVNDRTFSAPEAVAFSLQEAKRALILGRRSAGGAHMTDASANLSDEFTVGIPNKRPIGRLTGRTWEQVGVQPDDAISNTEVVRAAKRILEMSSSNDE